MAFPRHQIDLDTTDKTTQATIAPYVKIARKKEVKESEKFKHYLENKPYVLLQDMSLFLSDSVDLASILQETVDVLKTVTKANGATIYMVDYASEEIYLIPKFKINDRHKVNWKIEKGSTVAAYVAYKKEYVMVDDILCDERFPAGLGNYDDTIKSVLCVPIATTNSDCIAIIEMYRSIFEVPFTQEDLKISIVMAGWMAAAIQQNRLRLVLQQQKELNDYLLDLIKCYFADNVPLEKLITEIIKFAKTILGAERGSFFIIEPDSDDMTAEVFDGGLDPSTETMHKKHIKIRLGKSRSIPGLVARTGVTVNLRDAYNDPTFYTEVDSRTGSITRSILCMPIVSEDNILGVVQVINKLNGVVFTESDQNLFKTFSVYCALALHYTRLNTKMHRTALLNDSNMKLLNLQIKSCIHDCYDFVNNVNIKIPSSFNDFKWYISIDEQIIMPQMVFYMIKTIIGFTTIDTDLLIQFILSVRKCYQDKPYHNWEHAFNVTHCMYNILRRNSKIFTEVELKALLIACLCHDLDHGGYTNNYLQLIDDPFSQLYNESFLENHHYQVTMTIYNVFPFYTTSENLWHQIRDEIKRCILATDLANYFKVRMKLMDVTFNKGRKTIDWNDNYQRQLCKAIMMTACDLSGSCKPFLIAKRLTDNLIQEFYNQGDKEKAMGMTPLCLMDREKSESIPEDQVNFLTIIVLPCTELLKTALPNCGDLSEGALVLRETWQEIIDSKGVKSWCQNDSVIDQFEENDY